MIVKQLPIGLRVPVNILKLYSSIKGFLKSEYLLCYTTVSDSHLLLISNFSTPIYQHRGVIVAQWLPVGLALNWREAESDRMRHSELTSPMACSIPTTYNKQLN